MSNIKIINVGNINTNYINRCNYPVLRCPCQIKENWIKLEMKQEFLIMSTQNPEPPPLPLYIFIIKHHWIVIIWEDIKLKLFPTSNFT